MATYTSIRAGNWSSPLTWNGTGGFPGSGATNDIAIIATTLTQAVSGAANNGSGAIRLFMSSTAKWSTGQKAAVAGVNGTVEANNTFTNPTWVVTVADSTHLDLQNSTFTNAWTSGGVVNPVVFMNATPTNLIGKKASAGGAAITINATDANHYGILEIGSGVKPDIQGFDTTTNTIATINQYGWLVLDSGSTIQGDVAANFGSVILNKGLLIANGSPTMPVTFTIPSAIQPSWATQITNEAKSFGTNLILAYDSQNSIAISHLNHDWIANSTGTGSGTFGSSSLSFSSIAGDTSILTTQVSSLSAVNASGTYYVNYDCGLVYFYHNFSLSIPSFNATYKYLVDGSTWRGWGINTTQITTGNSLQLNYCNFQYMGDQVGSQTTAALQCQGLTGGQTDKSTTLSITNCTVSNCYRFANFYNCNGNPSNYIAVSGNVFNNCRGDVTTSWCLGTAFAGGMASPYACSYIQFNNNVLNQRNYWFNSYEFGGKNATHSYLQFNSNSGVTCGLLANNDPGMINFPNCQIKYNQIAFAANTFPNGSYHIQHFCGVAASSALVQNNVFQALQDFVLGPYLTIDSNIFYKSSMNFGSPQVQNLYAPNISITNNLFYDGTTSTFDVNGQDVTINSGPLVNLEWNFYIWYDGVIFANNTVIGYNNGMMWTNGCFDTGTTGAVIGLEVFNNIHYNGNVNFPSRSIWKAAPRTDNKCPVAIKQLDYNCFYNSGAPYQYYLGGGSSGIISGGTFLIGGSKYNFATRNVSGVYLSQPGYSNGSPHASSTYSLAYTITTSGRNETLQWGNGPLVQLVMGSGVVAAASNIPSPIDNSVGFYSGNFFDSTHPWSTTLNASNCPAGCWVKVTGGAGAGQIRMVTQVNTTSGVTVTPAWTTVPPNGSTYSLYNSEVQLYDGNGCLEGMTVIQPGTLNTNTGITLTLSGGGASTQGTASPILGAYGAFVSGLLTGATILTGGSGYTNPPVVTVNNWNGGTTPILSANLGTVQAGVDMRFMPSSSVKDTGITMSFNDVFADPRLTNVSSLPTLWYALPTSGSAVNAQFATNSSAYNTGTLTDCPALDFFGVSRPQVTNPDMGFYEQIGVIILTSNVNSMTGLILSGALKNLTYQCQSSIGGSITDSSQGRITYRGAPAGSTGTISTGSSGRTKYNDSCNIAGNIISTARDQMKFSGRVSSTLVLNVSPKGNSSYSIRCNTMTGTENVNSNSKMIYSDRSNIGAQIISIFTDRITYNGKVVETGSINSGQVGKIKYNQTCNITGAEITVANSNIKYTDRSNITGAIIVSPNSKIIYTDRSNLGAEIIVVSTDRITYNGRVIGAGNINSGASGRSSYSGSCNITGQVNDSSRDSMIFRGSVIGTGTIRSGPSGNTKYKTSCGMTGTENSIINSAIKYTRTLNSMTGEIISLLNTKMIYTDRTNLGAETITISTDRIMYNGQISSKLSMNTGCTGATRYNQHSNITGQISSSTTNRIFYHGFVTSSGELIFVLATEDEHLNMAMFAGNGVLNVRGNILYRDNSNMTGQLIVAPRTFIVYSNKSNMSENFSSLINDRIFYNGHVSSIGSITDSIRDSMNYRGSVGVGGELSSSPNTSIKYSGKSSSTGTLISSSTDRIIYSGNVFSTGTLSSSAKDSMKFTGLVLSGGELIFICNPTGGMKQDAANFEGGIAVVVNNNIFYTDSAHMGGEIADLINSKLVYSNSRAFAGGSIRTSSSNNIFYLGNCGIAGQLGDVVTDRITYKDSTNLQGQINCVPTDLIKYKSKSSITGTISSFLNSMIIYVDKAAMGAELLSSPKGSMTYMGNSFYNGNIRSSISNRISYRGLINDGGELIGFFSNSSPPHSSNVLISGNSVLFVGSKIIYTDKSNMGGELLCTPQGFRTYSGSFSGTGSGKSSVSDRITYRGSFNSSAEISDIFNSEIIYHGHVVDSGELISFINNTGRGFTSNAALMGNAYLSVISKMLYNDSVGMIADGIYVPSGNMKYRGRMNSAGNLGSLTNSLIKYRGTFSSQAQLSNSLHSSLIRYSAVNSLGSSENVTTVHNLIVYNGKIQAQCSTNMGIFGRIHFNVTCGMSGELISFFNTQSTADVDVYNVVRYILMNTNFSSYIFDANAIFNRSITGQIQRPL